MKEAHEFQVQYKRWKHLEPNCVFLGRYKEYDLYYTTDPLEGFVARWSQDAYTFVKREHKDREFHFQVAFERASYIGLI